MRQGVMTETMRPDAFFEDRVDFLRLFWQLPGASLETPEFTNMTLEFLALKSLKYI